MLAPTCLDDKVAYGLAMGTLDADASAAARSHLDSCDSCRELLAAVANTSEAPPPQTIGRYQILEVIGAGAMGIVYEAIDPQLERRVAIKLLRGDAHQDRLLREARAAAQLSHPNVIAVFDAGIADGEVFMAMELIRGSTWRKWLTDRDRTWREIIDVAIKAGRGLSALHRAELVHRDVKPDNILVADDGRIVVTDLGLVRLEAGSRPPRTLALTQTGAVVGTPAYAAPEHLDGAVQSDPRSDQFSYCVSVYEALAGRRPFAGSNIGELRDAIGRGAPPPIDGVPAVVNAVIARGLAADPAQRWPSIDQLVARFERILAPRRHVWIAAGVLGVAAATAGVVLAVSRSQAGPQCELGAGEIARTWHPAVRTAIGLGFARANVSYAASTWQSTARMIDDYAARWAAAYDDACAATHVRHVQSASVLDLRAQCLDRRRVELAALLEVLAKPDRTQIGNAANAVGSLISPSTCADAELLGATEPMPDAPELRRQVIAARAELARVDAQSASGHLQEALTLAREVSATAGKVGYAPLIAEVDISRGRIAMDLQQWDEAKAAFDNAMLAAERGRHHLIRGDVMLGLVYLAFQQHDPARALEELKRADALVTGLGGNDQNRAKVEDYRGMALVQLARLDEAQAALTRSIALYKQGEGPNTISLANPLTNLAYVHYQRGKIDEAIELLRTALDVQLAALGPEHPRIATAYTNLAFNLSAADRLEEAQKAAEAALAIYAKTHGVGSVPYAEATRAVVGILIKRRDYVQAEVKARAIVQRFATGRSEDAADYANALDDLAATLVFQDKREQAVALRQQVLELREQIYPPAHPHVLSGVIELADVLADLERCRESLALYDRAKPHVDSKDVPPYLATMERLGRGRCLVDLGRHQEAIAPLRDALARNAEPQDSEDRGLRARGRFLLAQALWATRSRKEADELAGAAEAEATELHDAQLIAAIAKWRTVRK